MENGNVWMKEKLKVLLPASMKTLGFPAPAFAIWMTLRSRPSTVLPMETVLTKS